MARDIVEGDARNQYALLWSYCAELQKASRLNTCKIQLERPSPNVMPKFGRFFMCLEGCKKGFLAACRPFIGVDGCHLKTKYGGQLLVAIGRDPNDQYFPLAFVVVETETKDSWRWFVTLLLEDLGDTTRRRGLVQMFEEMMEGVEHRLCLRHLYENFKKKFGGGTMIRDLMMAAAKATYEEAWRGKMNELKALNKKAYDWLVAISTKAWCKHAFSFYPSCDVLMNNLSEEFNSTILLARDKPIITMFEWIRTYIMALFATLNKKFSKYNGRVMPKPRKRLDREIQMSGNWLATWASELKFEVTHTIFCDKFIVNLGAYSCTCNFWELVGIPCRHVVAAICMRGDKPEDYVHQYYLRETYAKCYGQTISPINGQNKWYVTNNDTILPPDFKRGPSRPKKLRRRMLEEDENPTKLRRTHTSNRCGRCLQYGHNKRNCPNPLKQPEGGGEQQQQPTTTKSKENYCGVGTSGDGNPSEAATSGVIVTGVVATNVASRDINVNDDVTH
ncbi:uncharacterized protein LOC114916709 [Cajanus cajan]|uniref:uncharacterized protein LOC114916709 n=1 Tax=Cajanus cajan TaxID=3821 RepID=UPI0010FB3F8C|nr:uncharacterized protein LOC114916709 [Cajanus cajan]